MTRLSGYLSTVTCVALVVAVWEVLVRTRGVPSYILPSPSVVAARWLADPGFFLGEGLIALGEALGGLFVGASLALAAGLVMAQWRWLERAILPLALVVKMTPVVVVAPLFVLWFGFGALPRILVAAMLTFFPVLISAVTGLRATPGAARDVLLMLNASAVEETTLLGLPAALPHLFAALKISATLALLGAVIAEWVGGDRGLGRAILLANSTLDIATALAGVFTLALIGTALVGGLALLERRVVFWTVRAPDA